MYGTGRTMPFDARQTLLGPELLNFPDCDFKPSALRLDGFRLDLPTVPGTAKPVKSKLQ
jgi:hypothetical protein